MTDSASIAPIDLSIIVVNYNTASMLPRFFESVRVASTKLRVQTIFVDNASTDDSVRVIRRNYAWVELIENSKNIGFGRANNQALKSVLGRYVLLLNTDAFIEAHSLVSALEYMDSHPRVGVLGAMLISEDGTLQPSCRYFPTPWNTFLHSTGISRFFPSVSLVDDYSWDHRSTKFCDWVPGCFYLIRRAVIAEVGLFDPRYFLYFEEVDHCRAVKNAGWNIVYFPGTKVIHIGGESAKSHGELSLASRQISAMQIESELLYYRKQHGLPAVVAAYALALVESCINLGSACIRFRDLKRAKPAVDRLAKMTSLLFKTGLGSRPTR